MNTIQRIQFRDTVRERYPNIPEHVLRAIVDREAQRPGNKGLSPTSYYHLGIASVTGYIRHRMTEYDALLSNMTRDRAKDVTRPAVTAVCIQWS